MCWLDGFDHARFLGIDVDDTVSRSNLLYRSISGSKSGPD